jgi:hypothetical protein
VQSLPQSRQVANNLLAQKKATKEAHKTTDMQVAQHFPMALMPLFFNSIKLS